jgi:branched-subunit amino acid aminotransferase/4-amino-4-deoxychorismate lyase
MKILSNEMAQHYQKSSLNRGHLVFTSFISQSGKILFLKDHIARLLKGADYLFPNEKWKNQQAELEQHVLDVFKKDQSDSYFRLTVFDDCVHLEKRALENNSETTTATIAFKRKTPGLAPDFLKISNYLESDLELARAKEQGFEDIFYLDQNERLTEASTSNIFVLGNNGVIKTPPTSSMVLLGITREKLIAKLKTMKLQVREATIDKGELEKAQEIWLTNSVKGIRFVSRFENTSFKRNHSTFDQLLLQFGRYGERYE